MLGGPTTLVSRDSGCRFLHINWLSLAGCPLLLLPKVNQRYGFDCCMSRRLCFEACLGGRGEGGGILDKGRWSVGRVGVLLLILDEELWLSGVSTK